MQIVTDKNKVALYFKDNAVSYKEFILNTKKIKQYTNIKEFTNNMIYMENRPELLYSFFSIWDSRATCVCIDASSTAEELSYYIDNSEVEKIFTSRGQLEKVEEAFTILNKKVELVIVDDIEFDKGINVFVGMHGHGKTLMIKTITALLNENIAALRSYPIGDAELTFENGETITYDAYRNSIRKSFYCVCCHFLGFCKDVVKQQVIRLKGVTGVTANLKWIQKCFLGMFLFTMPLCASYCSMQRKGTHLRRTFSMSTGCADG